VAGRQGALAARACQTVAARQGAQAAREARAPTAGMASKRAPARRDAGDESPGSDSLEESDDSGRDSRGWRDEAEGEGDGGAGSLDDTLSDDAHESAACDDGAATSLSACKTSQKQQAIELGCSSDEDEPPRGHLSKRGRASEKGDVPRKARRMADKPPSQASGEDEDGGSRGTPAAKRQGGLNALERLESTTGDALKDMLADQEDFFEKLHDACTLATEETTALAGKFEKQRDEVCLLQHCVLALAMTCATDVAWDDDAEAEMFRTTSLSPKILRSHKNELLGCGAPACLWDGVTVELEYQGGFKKHDVLKNLAVSPNACNRGSKHRVLI